MADEGFVQHQHSANFVNEALDSVLQFFDETSRSNHELALPSDQSTGTFLNSYSILVICDLLDGQNAVIGLIGQSPTGSILELLFDHSFPTQDALMQAVSSNLNQARLRRLYASRTTVLHQAVQVDEVFYPISTICTLFESVDQLRYRLNLPLGCELAQLYQPTCQCHCLSSANFACGVCHQQAYRSSPVLLPTSYCAIDPLAALAEVLLTAQQIPQQIELTGRICEVETETRRLKRANSTTSLQADADDADVAIAVTTPLVMAEVQRYVRENAQFAEALERGETMQIDQGLQIDDLQQHLYPLGMAAPEQAYLVPHGSAFEPPPQPQPQQLPKRRASKTPRTTTTRVKDERSAKGQQQRDVRLWLSFAEVPTSRLCPSLALWPRLHQRALIHHSNCDFMVLFDSVIQPCTLLTLAKADGWDWRIRSDAGHSFALGNVMQVTLRSKPGGPNFVKILWFVIGDHVAEARFQLQQQQEYQQGQRPLQVLPTPAVTQDTLQSLPSDGSLESGAMSPDIASDSTSRRDSAPAIPLTPSTFLPRPSVVSVSSVSSTASSADDVSVHSSALSSPLVNVGPPTPNFSSPVSPPVLHSMTELGKVVIRRAVVVYRFQAGTTKKPGPPVDPKMMHYRDLARHGDETYR